MRKILTQPWLPPCWVCSVDEVGYPADVGRDAGGGGGGVGGHGGFFAETLEHLLPESSPGLHPLHGLLLLDEPEVERLDGDGGAGGGGDRHRRWPCRGGREAVERRGGGGGGGERGAPLHPRRGASQPEEARGQRIRGRRAA